MELCHGFFAQNPTHRIGRRTTPGLAEILVYIKQVLNNNNTTRRRDTEKGNHNSTLPKKILLQTSGTWVSEDVSFFLCGWDSSTHREEDLT